MEKRYNLSLRKADMRVFSKRARKEYSHKEVHEHSFTDWLFLAVEVIAVIK
jgi:hypothetical protein